MNVEKMNSSKTINVETYNENNDEFNISRSDVFDMEPIHEKEKLGLDFLTQDIDQDPEDQNEEQQEEDNFIMEEPNTGYNENTYEQLSYEEMQQRKGYVLYNLNRYRNQGFEWSRNFGPGHTLEELETELSRIETEKDLDNGIKICKDGLLVFTKAIETANTAYGPDWIKLNGWTAFVMEEYKTHKYDDCFVKLWQKYKSKLPESPEFTLIWLLGTSAFVFHMGKLQAEAEMNKRNGLFQAPPQMREPSMNFDDIDLTDSDTNSVISEIVNTDTLNISIPPSTTETKQKKPRGRPKKNAG